MRMVKSQYMMLSMLLLRQEELWQRNSQAMMYRYELSAPLCYLADHFPVKQTLFIESSCNDERIIEENVRNVKISSPDVSVSTPHAINS